LQLTQNKSITSLHVVALQVMLLLRFWVLESQRKQD